MKNLNSRDELGWLAFRYVNEELSAVEVADFEERLASDQAVREAVAEVVLLGQAILALQPVECELFAGLSCERELSGLPATHTSSRKMASWQSIACAGLAVAACLLVMLVPAGLLPTESSRPAVSDRDFNETYQDELAVAWASALSEPNDALAVERTTDLADEIPSESAEAEVVAESDASTDFLAAPPSWMLEAIGVRNPAGNTPSGEI